MDRPKLSDETLLRGIEKITESVGNTMRGQDSYISSHEMFGFLTVAYMTFQKRLKESAETIITAEELEELLAAIAVEAVAGIASLYEAGEATKNVTNNTDVNT
jgi:predicted house-cleaning noncanonical NTP pyrophosphatase (MazG superfamily)